MNTSESIKKARKDAGITQAELAERLGITPQMISQYERGSKKPSFETAEKIFNALGIDEWEIEEGGAFFCRRHYELPDNLTSYLRTLHGEGAGKAYKETDLSPDCTLSFPAGSYASKVLEIADTISRLPDMDAAAAQFHKMMQDFNKLNPAGREKALERVHELTEVPRYTSPAVTPAPASTAESTQAAPQSPAWDTDTPKED